MREGNRIFYSIIKKSNIAGGHSDNLRNRIGSDSFVLRNIRFSIRVSDDYKIKFMWNYRLSKNGRFSFEKHSRVITHPISWYLWLSLTWSADIYWLSPRTILFWETLYGYHSTDQLIFMVITHLISWYLWLTLTRSADICAAETMAPVHPTTPTRMLN